MPKVSIVVPIYNMDDAKKFLKRNLDSITTQTFTDYEIVISDDSDDDMLKCWLDNYPIKYYKNKGSKGMANNSNNGIEKAKGEIIKILYQDDYFYNNNSLAEIVRHFKKCEWMVSGCVHSLGFGEPINEHFPFYSESENNIGSPSVLTFSREVTERFDPEFHWVLDLDLYKRLFREYGLPRILHQINVVIGIGEHQTTHRLSDLRKNIEHQLLREKYDNPSIKT